METLLFLAGLSAVGVVSNSSNASAFSFSFEWGDIPYCTSGNPNIVNNPNFKLSGVPQGAAKIEFHLRDNNVPGYDHGGGSVAYSGGGSVASGAFKYKSPCPPDGTHTYTWTATVCDKAGKKLATAKASKRYP
jgi:hypothetical protein